mgnify:CR=1 FL=1
MEANLCEVAYIVKPDCRFVGEIEDLTCLKGCTLENWGPLISDGDILRCFYRSGFIETYIIHIDTSRVWPSVYRLDKISN